MQIIWRLELKNGKTIDVFSPWLDQDNKPLLLTNNKPPNQEIPVVIVAIRFVPKMDDILPDGFVETIPAHYQLISGIKGASGVMPFSGLDLIWADEVHRCRKEELPQTGQREFEPGPSKAVNNAYELWWDEISDEDEDEDDEEEPAPKEQAAKPAEQAAQAP